MAYNDKHRVIAQYTTASGDTWASALSQLYSALNSEVVNDYFIFAHSAFFYYDPFSLTSAMYLPLGHQSNKYYDYAEAYPGGTDNITYFELIHIKTSSSMRYSTNIQLTNQAQAPKYYTSDNSSRSIGAGRIIRIIV